MKKIRNSEFPLRESYEGQFDGNIEFEINCFEKADGWMLVAKEENRQKRRGYHFYALSSNDPLEALDHLRGKIRKGIF